MSRSSTTPASAVPSGGALSPGVGGGALVLAPNIVPEGEDVGRAQVDAARGAQEVLERVEAGAQAGLGALLRHGGLGAPLHAARENLEERIHDARRGRAGAVYICRRAGAGGMAVLQSLVSINDMLDKVCYVGAEVQPGESEEILAKYIGMSERKITQAKLERDDTFKITRAQPGKFMLYRTAPHTAYSLVTL
jgi:hypothetical protein